MTQTLTTDRLKQITDAISAEPHDYESIYDSIKHGEIAAMARELLANREAQPVAYIGAQMLEDLTDGARSCGRVWVRSKDELSADDRLALYTAPPATAVVKLPTEFYSDEGVVVRLEEVMAALALVGVKYERKGNACRAAMLAQPVSQGKLPDNVREALVLALQAMEFMGDTLNNIDAVCTEDVEYVTPAFTAVRGLLAAAPEGGN
ncbi:hypothetical protein M2407_000051 [Serratia sp. BIGb0234]|uniref:hypothetical protein n=1 Tax=Serratia sp. BIGb0234 TaxID=2940614 RepID=UPI002166C314|nr:hypothetical protein [Serratia sp. BIGb0234]MCS4315752.1 hypothetical protein [Serratia sp. BIGb0234]